MKDWLSKNSKTLKIIGITLIILALPLVLILVKQNQDNRGSAAAADKLETEGGTLSSTGVSKQTDTTASGGQYVLFASQTSSPTPTNTPTPTPVTGFKYPPDTTMTSKSVPSLARPGYLSPITEPVFGTKLTRVTDPSAFGGSTTIRHHYSKDSAWNRDGTYMIMDRYLLNGRTYQVIKTLPVSGEFRWSNTDPDKIFVITSAGSFQSYKVSTNQTTLIRTFSGYDEVRMGPWEGNISTDDGMVVLTAKKGTDFTAIVFNIKQNQVIGSPKTFPGKWDAGIDWASISSSGRYVVINHAYCPSGGSCSGNVESYDLNLNLITQVAPKGEHADLTTDVDGNDYLVQVLGTSGYITKRRVDTGQETILVRIGTGGHISCRNILRPGWCYATLSSSSYREAIAFKLDGSGTVNRFAHHRSTQSTYDTEAKGVASMDGTKILWTSDWGTPGSFFDYVAESF